MSTEVIKAWRAHAAATPAAAVDWVTGHRRRALDAFGVLGFPTRRDEAYKYNDLRASTRGARSVAAPAPDMDRARALADGITPAGCAGRIVLVNGVFAPELSSLDALGDGLVVAPLESVLDDRRDDIAPLLARFTESFDDGFVALSHAFFGRGVFIRVSKNVEVSDPVALISVSVGAGTWMEPFTHVLVAERHSSVTVVEAFAGDAESDVLRCPSTFMRLDTGARVGLVKAQCEGAAAHHMAHTWAEVGRDAHLEHFQFTLGGATSRDNTTVRIDEQGAHCDLSALFVARGAQQADHHTTIDHRVPNTTSHQLYKGIFDDRGHGIFNGRVFVRQDAQQTNAEQLNNNLLLSTGARVDTKPQLEIYADDVKCSHGATIGQLSAEELFYLQSRAIGVERARAMLVRGFAGDALTRVTHEGIAELLSQRFDESFSAAR